MTVVWVVLISLALLLAAFLAFRRNSEKQDKPGPHNNWRRGAINGSSSGWSENFPGNGSDGGSVGSGGGGGGD